MAKVYMEKLSELTKRAAPKGFNDIKLEVKHFSVALPFMRTGIFS